MNRSQPRITRSTASRLHAFLKHCEEDPTSAILVTLSETGRGIHMRWQYPESDLDQETNQIGHHSAANSPAQELTIDIEDEFAHLFSGSLSSIGSTQALQDLGLEDELFTSLFDGSLLSVSSTSSFTHHTNDSIEVEDTTEGEEAMTPRATTPLSPLPACIPIHPDNFTEDEILRRKIREEQRIEETFRNQWQKMLEQRKTALQTFKNWSQGSEGSHDGANDLNTEDEDGERHMEIDGYEDRGNENVSADGMMTITSLATGSVIGSGDSSDPSGIPGENGSGNAPCLRRPLGPCGTEIVENPYMRGKRTTPPPTYPQEWVTRRLAGRESTESV